jgi:hypothetical protein
MIYIAALIIIPLVLVAIALPPLALFGILYLARRKWIEAGPERSGRRAMIVCVTLAILASPYVAFKFYERKAVLARVPQPLRVQSIEYRLEEQWGIGGPGDSETGFVVYRLTDESAAWARRMGKSLPASLFKKDVQWQPTPVDDTVERNQIWHRYDEEQPNHKHEMNLEEFLDKYGFSIPIEKGRTDDANHAIRNPGSFYTYSRGGGITIVDPRRGKVYFAYAG